MKKQGILWFLVAGVIVGIFLFFNSQGAKDFMPLGEIFPEQTAPQEQVVEYVYMDTQPLEKDVPLGETVAPPVQESEEIAVESETTPSEEKQLAQDDVTSDDITSSAFTIQVASFQNEAYAQSALKKLRSQGHAGQVVRKDLKDRGIWHRVYVGAFQKKAEAQDYIVKIKGNFPNSLIIKLK